MSTNTFKKPFNASSPEEYGNALQQLHNEIINVKKEVTYFDAYNITEVVESKDAFSSQINTITNNSGVVINCQPFSHNGEIYNTGDVVLKLQDNKFAHIRAQTGGLYYPSKLEKGDNGYVLTYAYKSSAPTEESSNVNIGDEAVFAKDISFSGLSSTELTNSYVYGIWDKMTITNGGGCSYRFKKQKHTINKDNKETTIDVDPVFEFFFVSGENIEKVDTEYFLQSPNDTEWNVIIGDQFMGRYFTESEEVWVKVK